MRYGKIVFFLLFISACIAYLILLSFAKPARQDRWFLHRQNDHHPLVMAHQGGEGEWPSNTMIAFRNAAQAGADVLDTDMHQTKDGVLILMHDASVDKTTNGNGLIRDMSIIQIKQLDAGYRFSTDNQQTFPYRGKGVTVPTVEELFQTFPDKRLGIEMKDSDIRIAERFCNLIKKYKAQHNVLVSSFRQETMDAFRVQCTEVATSATVNEVRLFLQLNMVRLTRVISPPYGSFQVPEKAGFWNVLTPSFVGAAHNRQIQILPWTINDKNAMKKMIRLGADGINTDYPTRLLRLLKKP